MKNIHNKKSLKDQKTLEGLSTALSSEILRTYKLTIEGDHLIGFVLDDPIEPLLDHSHCRNLVVGLSVRSNCHNPVAELESQHD